MANILIVDDDQLLCDGLAVRIADIGHQVLCSYTLADALEKARSSPSTSSISMFTCPMETVSRRSKPSGISPLPRRSSS